MNSDLETYQSKKKECKYWIENYTQILNICERMNLLMNLLALWNVYNWNVFCIRMALMYQMFGHKIWAWIDKVHYAWEYDI
jgi:hypothetical protein